MDEPERGRRRSPRLVGCLEGELHEIIVEKRRPDGQLRAGSSEYSEEVPGYLHKCRLRHRMMASERHFHGVDEFDE